MAITRGNTTDYLIPNGMVDFNRFPIVNGVERKDLAKGLRYLGASKEFNLSIESETIEHQSSECGKNVVDEEFVKSTKISGSLVIDNISAENLAMFFSGDVTNAIQTAKTGEKDIIKVSPGLGYRLGATRQNPNGVFAAVITKIETFADEGKARAGTPKVAELVADTDYSFNADQAYLTIGDKKSTDKIADEGTWIVVTYDLKAATRNVVVSRGETYTGELYFRGCNVRGENRWYRIPRAKLEANGDFSLKGGEDYTSMSFTVTVLKDNDDPTMLYSNGTPVFS